MARCTRRNGLEVHHKRRDGGTGLDNAEVLCQRCHEATSTYAEPGKGPPAFDESAKDKALKRAGGQCECARTGGCH